MCKVVSYVFGKDPNLPIKKDICSRLNFLFTELKYDESKIRKLGIYNRVNEFRQFRNELFHDRNTGEEIKFKKTKFSSLPVFSNQVDTFQAFLIFIEVVILFRYSFKGLDIMPNTPIGSSNIMYFDKLDNLYNKYLKPYFEQTLLKQNLETKINLNINSFISLPPNDPIYQGEIVIVSRIKQDIKFEHSLNQTITSMGKDLYFKIVESYNTTDDHFKSLNFVLDWPELYKSKFPMRR